ncbi:antirestriction protein [Escherichia coli]|nr:antirestriction protein [Escherichia coli]
MQYAKPVTLNVEECDRLSFLPYLFGNDFLYAEAYVYALAQKMMPEYQGGFWHCIRLPDGGGHRQPDYPDVLRSQNARAPEPLNG